MTLDDSTTAVPSPRTATDPLPDAALYRALAEAFPDVTVFVLGPDLRYRLIAGAGVTRIGWRPAEVVGRRPSDLLPAGEAAQFEEHCRAALTGETRHYEHRGIRDDSAVWASTISPVRDDGGAIVAGMVVSRDIASIRQAQRARRESEERFAVALEAAPVSVFTQDPGLRYTWMNKVADGYGPDSLIGRTDDDVLDPAAAAVLIPAKRQVLATGEGRRLMVEAQTAEGTRFFDITLQPTRDDDGAVSGLIGAALDVTELRTSEQRLRAALEAMLDSVTIQHPVVDEHGAVVDFRISYANRQARDFAGRGPDAIVGRRLSTLYPQLGTDFIDSYVQVLVSGEGVHFAAFPYLDDDARIRLYDLAVSRVGDALLVVWRDVTEREADRAAAAEANAARAVSEQLQRGLLPPASPVVPGLQFAAAYRPATTSAEVGGDWYDVVNATAGTDAARHVDLVVGDVEGHDGEAAALMARLSSVIRADSQRGRDLETMLCDLRSFHSGLNTERLASVVVARIDRGSDAVHIVSAGHPPPLLRRATGAVERMAMPIGAPVGAPAQPATATRLSLAVGEVLLLFSDGLLDPRADVDDALDRIAVLAERFDPSDIRSLVDALADETRDYQPSDDVVVLAVRRVSH